MRVLEKGIPYLWTKEIRCTGEGNGGKGCNAKLLIDKEDLFTTSSHPYGDSSPTYFITFECCDCHVLTDIDIEDWPCHWGELPTRDTWKKIKENNLNVVEESKEEG